MSEDQGSVRELSQTVGVSAQEQVVLLRELSAEATPGPWFDPHFTRDDTPCNCHYLFGEQDFMGAIATIHEDDGRSIEEGGGDDPKHAEAVANARLIVAAVNFVRQMLAESAAQ